MRSGALALTAERLVIGESRWCGGGTAVRVSAAVEKRRREPSLSMATAGRQVRKEARKKWMMALSELPGPMDGPHQIMRSACIKSACEHHESVSREWGAVTRKIR